MSMKEDWAKQEIPNQFLITDPTSCQPGFDQSISSEAIGLYSSDIVLVAVSVLLLCM